MNRPLIAVLALVPAALAVAVVLLLGGSDDNDAVSTPAGLATVEPAIAGSETASGVAIESAQGADDGGTIGEPDSSAVAAVSTPIQEEAVATQTTENTPAPSESAPSETAAPTTPTTVAAPTTNAPTTAAVADTPATGVTPPTTASPTTTAATTTEATTATTTTTTRPIATTTTTTTRPTTTTTARPTITTTEVERRDCWRNTGSVFSPGVWVRTGVNVTSDECFFRDPSGIAIPNRWQNTQPAPLVTTTTAAPTTTTTAAPTTTVAALIGYCAHADGSGIIGTMTRQECIDLEPVPFAHAWSTRVADLPDAPEIPRGYCAHADGSGIVGFMFQEECRDLEPFAFAYVWSPDLSQIPLND